MSGSSELRNSLSFCVREFPCQENVRLYTFGDLLLEVAINIAPQNAGRLVDNAMVSVDVRAHAYRFSDTIKG
jgi:hypothetical protein